MANYLEMMNMDLNELIPYVQNKILDNDKKYASVKLDNNSVVKIYKNKIVIDNHIYNSINNIDENTIKILNHEMNSLKKQGMFKLMQAIKMGIE